MATAQQPPPDPKSGQLIEWEGWSFRWQFRDIEGLMLTDVYFRDRKVLKAINLAEIYVPYATGQPRPEDFALGGFLALTPCRSNWAETALDVRQLNVALSTVTARAAVRPHCGCHDSRRTARLSCTQVNKDVHQGRC